VATLVVVYLDDILKFTETLEEHQAATWKVMELLQKHNLFLNPKNAREDQSGVPQSDYFPEFC